MDRSVQMSAVVAVLLTLLARGDGLCFTTTHNCTGASSNLESEEECCLGNGLSYGNGSECQICYVIGYSDDTRTQTINEGESSILTVEIKKPAVGVGSLLVINFQIVSPNSADIRFGGDSTQTGRIVSGTVNYASNISIDAKADQIGQEGVEIFEILLSVTSEELDVPVFVEGPALVTVNDRSVVLVELTESDYLALEDHSPIVSRISYNQSLANDITINFHPLTYDQYLNVLGLHLPDDILEDREIYFYEILIKDDEVSVAEETDFIGDVITVTLPQPGGGSSGEVEVEVPLIDDLIVEAKLEIFLGYIEIVNAVDIGTIVLGRNTTQLIIVSLSDDHFAVGFSATSYVSTETVGYVSICVDVSKPAGEIALQPFTVGLLPEPDFDTSNNQYTLECSVRLHFDMNDIRQCYEYTVSDDNICEIPTTEIFQVRLTLITTSSQFLQIHSNYSLASAWINDTEEPECFVRVGYKQSSYSLHEEIGYVEVCVVSSSPGIQWQFVINVTTTDPTSNTTAFGQSVQSLDFMNGSSETQCYNISVDFDMDDYCEQYFNCNNTLQSQLTKFNDSDHVMLINDMVEVFIKERDDKCAGVRECGKLPNKSTSAVPAGVIAAIIMLLLVIITMTSVMVLILLFYCRKTKQQKEYYNPSQDKDISSCEYSHDISRRANLLRELHEELKYTKMVFNKDQLQLSSTVGQGESGLVYKAYINTAVGKELVAVKTGKALFSTNDIERMIKEVSAMLNFKHPNVMSLIGVCLDGEMPLIILPFMSNGSVLEFVKSHGEELFLCSHAKIQLSTRSTFLGICHQITKGMAYLSEQKFVHRDLAARNCMIDWHGAIKVADFGLTEDMYCTNYFRRRKSETGSEEKVPIRWMAPESIEDDVYNECTDVWSFGVTIWEIFTCGRIPYPGIPAMSLLKILQTGQRLEQPENASCSDQM